MNKLTVEDMVQDIYRALDAKAYLSAFTLSLTLPDILAQVEYPEIKDVGKRYAAWMNNYYVIHDKPKIEHTSQVTTLVMEELDSKMDGRFYYKLRCSILHSGTNEVPKEMKDLDFELSFADFDFTSVQEYSGAVSKQHSLGIPQFCKKMCSVVKGWLREWGGNKEKMERLNRFGIKFRDYN